MPLAVRGRGLSHSPPHLGGDQPLTDVPEPLPEPLSRNKFSLRHLLIQARHHWLWIVVLVLSALVNLTLLAVSIYFAATYRYSLAEHLSLDQSLWPWWYGLLEGLTDVVLSFELCVRYLADTAAAAEVHGLHMVDSSDHERLAQVHRQARRDFWRKSWNILDVLLVAGCWASFLAALGLELYLLTLGDPESLSDAAVDPLEGTFTTVHLIRDLFVLARLLLLALRGAQVIRHHHTQFRQQRYIDTVLQLPASGLSTADQVELPELQDQGLDFQDEGQPSWGHDWDDGV